MGSERQALAWVVDLFPERREIIEEAFASNISFRSLCNDYRDCAEALSRLRRTLATTRSCEEEYSILLNELVEEIREWLDRLEVEPRP